MNQKTLIILRHAKAELAKPGQDDHERPLAERGIIEAELMGAFMAEQGIIPQKILCSTAVRTRETLEGVFPPPLRGRVREGGFSEVPHPLAPSLKGRGFTEFLPSLYNATEKQLLQIIAAQPEEVSSLMVIAHNPGLHQLAVRLSTQGETKSIQQLAADFPTCALAVIELAVIHWADIFTARGMLKVFMTPKAV